MNDLNKALGDISSIRRQMARSTEFHGYGPATLAGTGVLAVSAAGVQAVWLPDPANHISAYLSIWIWTAVLSAASIGLQMYTRTRRIHSGMADEMIRMAVEQFLPSVGAGALITIVLAGYFQSRRVFVVPFSAEAGCRGGRVVPADGISLYCAGGQPGALPMGHGYPLRSRAVAGRGNSAL